MIRIGFDGRALASPAAGVRRYARELFGALAALDSGVEVVAVGVPRGVLVPRGVRAVPGGATAPTNFGWMLTGLATGAARAGLDLFHAPSYTAPVRGPRPIVLTVHDVSYERHPEWYPYRRDPLRRAFYRWSARTADRILTDSEFSRGEIVAAYAVRPETIDVVPLAVGPSFSPGPVREGGTEPFVLHVGDVHPRRNLSVALRAVQQVRARRPEAAGLRLVLAGAEREGAEALRAMASAGGGRPVLDVRGPVSEEELVSLYRSAAAVVYPSLYEGFGLPLLEAMASGAPVIAARAASIPEVTGDAAVLLDPHDAGAWADAIEAVLDPVRATTLRDAGYARAARFTWRRTAQLTMASYLRALGRAR